MTFRLDAILGRIPAGNLRAEVERSSGCPTGKVAFPSKRAAREALRGQAGHRTAMHPFRCGFCCQYHLGHRRGAIL